LDRVYLLEDDEDGWRACAFQPSYAWHRAVPQYALKIKRLAHMPYLHSNVHILELYYTALHWIIPILMPDYTISAKCGYILLFI
jgi:hypothetical protein